jgi:hypothetical protein
MEIIMQTKTTTNRNYYLLNHDDIFESIRKRTQAENDGSTVIVPHVCNNIDLFDAGFAGQVAKHYPEVKANYHMLGKNFLRNNLGHSQIIKVYEQPKYKHKLYFVNMIAQNGVRSSKNSRPLNYAALVKSMIQVSQFIHNNTAFLQKNENVEIHAPKFGSGLAGGNWNFINELIDDVWSKYHVFVYNSLSK